MKRGYVILLLILVSLSFVNAGIFDWFKKDEPQLAPQNFSVTVGNSVPSVTINSVNNGNNVVLNPGIETIVEINFSVTDDNGVGDLDESTLFVNYSYDSGGEDDRTGVVGDCTSGDSGNTRTYICEVNMSHYDASGAWTAYLSIDDTSGPATGSDSSGFTVNQLQYITLTPQNIPFGTVSPGQNNILSQDNTTVANEGNYNIISNDMEVTAYNLTDSGGSNYIPANNFTSDDQSEVDVCGNGHILSHGSPVQITAFVLSKGDSGTPLPTREIQHCMDVPPGIPQATYSTENTGSQAWDFAI